MHIKDVDLNLLRLFDAVYRTRSVSRAAQVLGLTQPAASQGLTRLRLLIQDPLFTRAPGGVQPTAKADRLSAAVASALTTLELALNESSSFEPAVSAQTFRLHLSDIGEARFLPALISAVRRQAPSIRVESAPLPHDDIAAALNSGRLDVAIGFLPTVQGTRQHALLQDRYIVLLRQDHPWLSAADVSPSATVAPMSPPALGKPTTPITPLSRLRQLDYAAVRSHAETLHILQLLQLEDRLRLTAAHFLALPDIVRSTDLAVLMPRNIAQGFAQSGDYVLVEPQLPLSDFTVSLHWSARFEHDPANRWLRELVTTLFEAMPLAPTGV
jgi:DNA-binding transcriptional LysR family regulator